MPEIGIPASAGAVYRPNPPSAPGRRFTQAKASSIGLDMESLAIFDQAAIVRVSVGGFLL